MVLSVAASAVALPSVAVAQDAMPAGPAGWHTERSDDRMTAVPPDLGADEIFVIGLEANLQPRGKALRDWFRQKVDASIGNVGSLIKDEGIAPRGSGLATSRTYRSPAGTVVVASFLVRKQQDGAYLLVGLICTQQACKAHAAAARQWADSVAAGGGEGMPAKPAAPPPPPAYQTEPGRGIKPSEIEDVNHVVRVSGLGSASLTLILLLKNGDYCTNLNLPPADMNVAAHKKAFPDDWGKWRRRGDGYQTLEGGTWRDADWDGSLRPARAGDQLDGTFTRMSSGGLMIGSTSVVSSKTIAFLPHRRFRINSFGGVSTAGAGAGPATAHASSARQGEGTYRLDGRTIEFRFDDGTVDRKAFHWMNAKKRDSIVLNSSFYFIDR